MSSRILQRSYCTVEKGLAQSTGAQIEARDRVPFPPARDNAEQVVRPLAEQKAAACAG